MSTRYTVTTKISMGSRADQVRKGGGGYNIRQGSRVRPDTWWGAGATPCWGVWGAKNPRSRENLAFER